MRAVLVDENFPRAVAEALTVAGHDVASVATLSPGLDDMGVLQLARSHGRWLLTFDADFGELVFHRSAMPPAAIVFFRLHPVVISELIELSLRALEEVSEGSFCVVTREGTRVRPFPSAHVPEPAPNSGAPPSDGRA